jgi:hypothetical protein
MLAIVWLLPVAVHDVEHVGGRDEGVDVRVLGDHSVGAGEPVGEEAAHEDAIGDPAALWPGLGIKIAVHEELGEREKAEDDHVRLDLPSGLRRNRLGDLGEVRGGIEGVARLERRQPSRKASSDRLEAKSS